MRKIINAAMTTVAPMVKGIIALGVVFGVIWFINGPKTDSVSLDRFHLRVVTPALRGEPLVVDLGNAQWLVVSDYAVVSDAQLRTLIRDSRRGDLRAWSVVQRDGGVAE